MRRMRILLAVILSLLTLASAAHAQVGVPEVERYVNSIRTVQARFVQSNPNGSVVQGTLYIRRPGRMRFEYDAPSKLKIVADGSQVTLWDPATRDFGQWPIGWTAASFLVREPFKLSGDLTVESQQRTGDGLQLTIGGQDHRSAGGKSPGVARLVDRRQSRQQGRCVADRPQDRRAIGRFALQV
jgi:outer membrane lipoprotein-sorting protein